MEASLPAKTANQLAEERTALAVTRTALAADRTLMAWMRTGLSMISFGFTLTLPGLGATRHQFRGRVDGDHVRGTAVLTPADSKPLEVAWHGQRGDAARWFRPTGTNIK